MWVLIVSFILISSAGLAGVSKIIGYSKSFGFGAAAATAAAGGIALFNGLGRMVLGGLSDRIGRENAMIGSYVLTGVFLFLTMAAGAAHSEPLFVLCVIGAFFFWGPMFSLFPAVIGHYYGDVAAGANYGLLYAIAKGTGGLYAGVLSAILIGSKPHLHYGLAMGIAAGMAIAAGLIIIPLKANPPVKKTAGELAGSRAPAE
jgi:OFA family oxalate/formate antiporter-like MFS transporter